MWQNALILFLQGEKKAATQQFDVERAQARSLRFFGTAETSYILLES
jgi:hypothetical protein